MAILVVDDIPANLISAQAALEPLGRSVVSVGTGHQALAQLLERDFALILLDVQMPGMDGFETAALIRERAKTKHIPIIFVTAHNNDLATTQRAYGLGAVDFLFKPIDPSILRAKASVFLTLQQQADDLANARMRHTFDEARHEHETNMLRRRMEEERASTALLAAVDRRKDVFLATLSHELRNPLAPIRAAIDLLKREPRAADSKPLEILDRQSKHLVRLIDDLLDLSRIKENKLRLKCEELDLRAVIEEAVSASSPNVSGRGHLLITSCASTPITVQADRVRMCQVVANLINNAARYTPRGGRIELRCDIVDGAASIVVTDNGIGIAPELISTMFDLFVQERVGTDGSGGLGLGLSLARQLVEMHGGHIRASSKGRGQGATFSVSLPLADGVPSVPVETQISEHGVRGLRAVVVDDNEDARELLCAVLRAHGHSVVGARNGREGLALIVAQRPDVAIVDIGMPDMDGNALAEMLRNNHPEVRTRLIALTGFGSETDRERSKKAGFDVHLVKPASSEVIAKALLPSAQLDR